MIQSRDRKELFKAFLKFAVPSIIGMFLTSFIVIVDGMFIAWGVGEVGLAAVNITIPVLYVFLGMAIMVGVGGSTIAAQCLGERNFKRADGIFTFTVLLNIIINSTMLILLIIFEENIINILNAKEAVLPYVRDYMGIIKYCYFFSTVNITLSIFVRSEGRPQFALLFGVLGNILNIILDYVFILGLGYGMKGAALASCLAVFIPLMLCTLYFIFNKSAFHFTAVRFAVEDLKNIIYNGSSEFISQLSISITTYLFNLVILRRIGISGVAAFAVIGYVSFIESMILTGIAQGIHPLISYNYGAKNKETIMILLSIGLKSLFICGHSHICCLLWSI